MCSGSNIILSTGLRSTATPRNFFSQRSPLKFSINSSGQRMVIVSSFFAIIAQQICRTALHTTPPNTTPHAVHSQLKEMAPATGHPKPKPQLDPLPALEQSISGASWSQFQMCFLLACQYCPDGRLYYVIVE